MEDRAGMNELSGAGPGDPYRVPPEAIYLLLLQRASYRFQPLYRPFSWLGLGGFYKQRVTRSFVEVRRADTIGRKYQQDIEATLDRVQKHLPARVEAAVDV